MLLMFLDKYTKILIIDNGHGISQELGEKVFEPKFTTKTSGMGLGLGIVKNILDSPIFIDSNKLL